MSKAEIDRFVGDVRENRELLSELSDGVIGLGHFVDKAKQRGYRFTVEEAKDYIREKHGVSDQNLEAVVGGGSVSTNTNVATQAEAVTAAVEYSHAATSTNAAAEAEVGVVAVGVIVAS